MEPFKTGLGLVMLGLLMVVAPILWMLAQVSVIALIIALGVCIACLGTFLMWLDGP